MNSENKYENSNKTFGSLVSNLRHCLGLTQEDLGNILLTSRVTVVKIEKSLTVSEISDELLFKLYYCISKVKENNNFDEIVKFTTKIIYEIINLELYQRINQKTDFIDLENDLNKTR